MFEFKFPDVAEGIHEGKLISWLVKEGDEVTADQEICEIETDKSILQIPIPISGKIFKIHHEQGAMVKVGDILVTVDNGKAEKTKTKQATKQKDVPSNQTKRNQKYEKKNVKKQNITEKVAKKDILILPKDRKYAKEKGIVLEKVVGTGPGGRITRKDLDKLEGEVLTTDNEKNTNEKIIRIRSRRRIPPSIRLIALQNDIDPETFMMLLNAKQEEISIKEQNKQKQLTVQGKREKLSTIREVIKHRMELAWHIVPHAAVGVEIEVDNLVKERKKAKEKHKNKVKVTYLAYIVKAVAKCLAKFPIMNSSLDDVANEIIYRKEINIGIAVDTEYGLIVPNIKNSDKKSLLEIAAEIEDLATRSREKKIKPAEITKGTFTITNIGSFGGVTGSSIVNYPESAILMVGTIINRESKSLLPLQVTFDHRTIDGGDAGRFLNTLSELLNKPEKL